MLGVVPAKMARSRRETTGSSGLFLAGQGSVLANARVLVADDDSERRR
jgi:hypothetical protein